MKVIDLLNNGDVFIIAPMNVQQIFPLKRTLVILIALSFYSFSMKEEIAPRTFVAPKAIIPMALTNEISDAPSLEPLDSTFQRFVKDWRLVGASVAVMKEGKLVYAKGFGKPERRTDELLQPYHQFRLASVSKLITATAIMKLVDDGKLSLDSKVFGKEGILNSEAYANPYDSRVYDITVEHLLRHLGGWSLLTIGDPMFKPVYIAQELGIKGPPSFDQIASFVLRYRIPYRPGSRYEYSNFGYCLLDRVIETVTNMPYEDYVKYHILLPNDINDMHIGRNMLEERQEGEVVHYDDSRSNVRESFDGSGEMVPTTYGATDIRTLEGAGGWMASSTELLKLISLIDGYADKPDILSHEAILKMVDTNVPGRSPIGWRKIYDEWTWMRTGTLAGSSAIVMRQDDGFTWAVLVNTSNWRSRRFNSRVKWMMSETLAKIEEWPERDLFQFR
ncbi:MAG: serine hydrolase domain-containing protein [Cyclobacteriaceae bacterium]